MGDIEEAVKTEKIAEVLSNATPSTAFWLKMFIVVLPIVLIFAAYFTMRKRIKIDENEYKRMLVEIESRKEDSKG